MNDAICDPRSAAPAYHWRCDWAWTVCFLSLVPVVVPPKALAPGDGIYTIGSMIALASPLLVLPQLWPTIFARHSAMTRPVWTRSGIRRGAFMAAARFFGSFVYCSNFLLSSVDLSALRVGWNVVVAAIAAVLVGWFTYWPNRRKLDRPMTARLVPSPREVPFLPVGLERSVVRAAPYALAVVATVLAAAGWLPREPSPYLGWSSVAVVALAWALPSLLAWVVEQVVLLPLVPIAVQAERCGFSLRERSTEHYLLRHALPWTGCLGLVTAQIMAGRPFWSLGPAMWLWAVPGLLAGSAGAYAHGELSGQADRD